MDAENKPDHGSREAFPTLGPAAEKWLARERPSAMLPHMASEWENHLRDLMAGCNNPVPAGSGGLPGLADNTTFSWEALWQD